MAKKNPNEERDRLISLMERFLKLDLDYSVARELNVFKELLEKYPEEKFWLNLDIGFRLNSLRYFQTTIGSILLSEKYKTFKMELAPIPVIKLGNKIGEDLPIVKRKKLTVKEFLNREYGEK